MLINHAKKSDKLEMCQQTLHLWFPAKLAAKVTSVLTQSTSVPKIPKPNRRMSEAPIEKKTQR